MQLDNKLACRVKRFLGRKSQSAGEFGSVSVGGVVIDNLRPLGGFRSPGVTKAGRLSFQGTCGGVKVKVYSALKPDQVKFRVALQSFNAFGLAFPPLIAYDARLVVEQWIDGVPIRNANAAERLRAKSEINSFLRNIRAEIELALAHRSAFCYFDDYLIPRLGAWRCLGLVDDFVSVWKQRLVEARLPSLISHADLSADNVLIEAATGRLVVIDNELLGVGPGWILDERNSFLKDFDKGGIELSMPVDPAFIELSWALRKSGSAIDAGEPGKALDLMRSALQHLKKAQTF